MKLCIRVFLTLFAITTTQAIAQTREQGPWWPHPVWGAEDQAGGSNWITPAKVLEAVKLIRTGTIYELGQVYARDMPLFGERTYAMFIPGSPTGGPLGKNQLLYHDEILTTEIGQVGTQFDGPGHIGKRITMADGTSRDVFYNGFTREEMHHPHGLKKLGIENIKPYITRGILIDIAGYKELEVLPQSYEVTLSDVRGALARQGISEQDIRAGDALFFRYGWSGLWSDPAAYNSNPPGIGLEVAEWVVSVEASMVGSDQWGTEVMPNPDSSLAFPVHEFLITRNGVWNLENMVFDSLVADGVYEFAFIFTPIRFKGGTGSPGRPIAIR